MANNEKKKKKLEPIGLDLIDEMPDYTKSWEENEKIYKERYKKVYGEEPPWMDKDKKE